MYQGMRTVELFSQLQTSLLAFSGPGKDQAILNDTLQVLSGLLVETALLFEEPDVSLMAMLADIRRELDFSATNVVLFERAHPCELDCQSEQGRLLAREVFEDWLDCGYEFQRFIRAFTVQAILVWEEEDLSRIALYDYLYHSAVRSMAFEIAAQELCDVVIDELIGGWGWTVLDSVAGLAAVAGHKLALSLDRNGCEFFRGADLPWHLDRIVHVMTQEAVRYGTPAGSDWRFGLAANDVPPNPPWEILCGVEPYTDQLLGCLPLSDLGDYSTACAKAAGRMIAVAAGGEAPEFEPNIVKPLAMAALSESYKSLCDSLGVVKQHPS